MKVAGYVRVSTKKQKEEKSHIRQKERLQDWAEKNGHEIKIFKDVAVSGQSINRDAYQELMNSLVDYDAIVVRELSRFGRNLQKILNDMDLIEEEDVEFISLRDNIDTTTAQGKLFFNIKSAFNQYWSDLASEQASEMIQRRKEKGKPIGRPKKLPPDEVKLVRKLYNNNLGYRAISKLSKVDDRFSKDVSPSTVMRYCQND